MKKFITIMAILLGLAGIVYFVPILREYRAFKGVNSEQTVFAADDFLYEYPNSEYCDSVRYLKVKFSIAENNDNYVIVEYINDYLYYYPEGKHAMELSFIKVTIDDSWSNILDFKDKFPQCEYSDRIEALYDKKWETEIQKFEDNVDGVDETTGIKYMRELLHYMKDNKTNTVVMNVSHNVSLKDYDEYPEYVRLIYDSEPVDFTTVKKVSELMVSLKNNFDDEDIKSIDRTILNSFQKGFDCVFSIGTVQVKNAEFVNDADKYPMLNVNYTIKNQTMEGLPDFPHIWTYKTSFNGSAYITKNVLLGISMSLKSEFNIPNSDTTYKYTENAEPENNIDKIDDIQDGYKKMTRLCAAQFSTKLANSMGLYDNE